MLKRIVIFLMVFLMMFACVGCGEKQKDESSNYVKNIIDESITKTHENLDIDMWENGVYTWQNKWFNAKNLEEIKSNNNIVELTCKTQDDLMYAVFRVHSKIIGDYYTYIFFNYLDYPEATSEDAKYHTRGIALKISKRLSAKDFDSIKIGSTVGDVAKIDPVTSISISKEDYFINSPILSVETFHYTENDGILHITYSRKTVNDEFRVSAIEIDPTYEVKVSYGVDNDNPYKITQKIKPEHLPN